MDDTSHLSSEKDIEGYILRKINRLQMLHSGNVDKMLAIHREMIDSKAEFEAELYELQLLIKDFCCSRSKCKTGSQPLDGNIMHQTLVSFPLKTENGNDDSYLPSNGLSKELLLNGDEARSQPHTGLKNSSADLECKDSVCSSASIESVEKNFSVTSPRKSSSAGGQSFSSPVQKSMRNSDHNSSLNQTTEGGRLASLREGIKEDALDGCELPLSRSFVAPDLTSTIAHESSNSVSLNNSSDRFPTYISPFKKRSSRMNLSVHEPKILINNDELVPNFKKITFRASWMEHNVILTLCNEWKPRHVYRLRTLIKGYFTRKLYNCKKVKEIRLDFQEYRRLLGASDFTNNDLDSRFVKKLNEKVEKCREEIHEIFFNYSKEDQLKLCLKDDSRNNSQKSSSLFSFLNKSKHENKPVPEKKRFLNKKATTSRSDKKKK